MKQLTYVLAAVFVVASAFVACKSDDEVEYSSDCYIKSMVLGNLSRTIHTTTTAGADTSYNVTVTGSAFPMSINHIEGTITNATPLPMGTNISAVTATVTSQGLVAYATDADATEWTQLTSKDTLDFSSPLHLRVIATDGKSYRDYTVTLKVRQNDADKYTWTQTSTVEALGTRKTAKMLMTAGSEAATSMPLILSSDAEGNCFAATMANGSAIWSDTPCEGLPTTADVSTAVVFAGAYWLTSTDGHLYTSADALVWNEVPQAEGIAPTLFAASATALYATATSDGSTSIVTSTDGASWQQMPTEKVVDGDVRAALAYTQANGNRRVLFASAADGVSTLDTWSLLEGYEQTWTQFSDDELNTYRLPKSGQLSIVAYNNRLFAFCDSELLVSDDNGINWKTDSNVSLPDGITAVRTAAARGEYIYLLSGKQLWQARLNSYGE